MMKKVSGMQSASPSLKIQLAKEAPSIIDLQSTGKTKERTVTSATVNKWKFELAEKGVSEWLPFSTDKDGKAQNMKCKVCTMYEYEIKKKKAILFKLFCCWLYKLKKKCHRRSCNKSTTLTCIQTLFKV